MFKVSLVLCYILMILGGNTQKSSSKKTTLYNSSDLSYLSNGIQFPVPAPLEANSVDDNDQKMPDIKWLTTLFDHHEWILRLKTIKNQNCSYDMTVYIENLKNGTSWATKSLY